MKALQVDVLFEGGQKVRLPQAGEYEIRWLINTTKSGIAG